MNVAIIGAGPAGLAAAYDLAIGGHKVTIFEATDRVGGLAAGFRDEGWDWELEKFYHHWFQTDHDILQLMAELGLSDKVMFPRPKTSMWQDGKMAQLDGAISALKYPLPIIPKIRFGFAGLYLRLANNWQWMEKYTAEEWLTRFMGKAAYEELWRPMLIGKFGPLYQEVTMAWFWARLHTRTTNLGTFEGGFQKFLDTFADILQKKGVTICFRSPVQSVKREGNVLKVTVGDQSPIDFDAVISTASPLLTLKIAPDISGAYADKLRNLRSIGAVVLILALKHKLMTDGTYWLNLPADTPDKSKNAVPFLALVEHTNYMDSSHYGGDNIVYCGDYIPTDHEYFKLTDEQLMQKFTGALKTFNPDFKPDWIRKYWVFRAPYAQPIPTANHSQNIPDLKTPVPGLYMANMSQVYPWDRGTSYAVGLGRQVARRVMEEVKVSKS